MKGRYISFTKEEIVAMDEFGREFDTYFSPERDKELCDFLINSHRILLTLRKFSPGKRDRIYFSYREIEFMADFICKIDSYFPGHGDKHLKEKLVDSIGPAMDRFVVCFNENYGSDDGWWPPKKTRYKIKE